MLPTFATEDVETSSKSSLGDTCSRTGTGDLESVSVLSQDSTHARDAVMRSEESAVRKTRFMVVLTVISCAVGIGLAVRILSSHGDLRSFEIEYEGFTTDIKALVRWEVRYNFALMEQLSAQITIASGLLNQSFPFHTEPQYEITGGFVDGMGGIMSAAFAPLVTEDQREEWEEYSVEHEGWIEESAYLKRVHPGHRDALHGTIQDHEHDRRLDEYEYQPISPVIYRNENGEKVPEEHAVGKVYAPLWQVSPADAGVVNINLFSDSRVVTIYEEMLKANGASILSQSTEIGDMFDFLFDPGEKIFKKDPHGFILAPVYTEIEEHQDQTIAGIIIGVTPFGNLLDRLLPQGTDGIIGVFRDNCGDVMSFELSSGKALFLGYEDVHETEMNEYERVEENIEMYQEIVEGLCAHDLYLYPTTKMRDRYTTSHAGTYAAIFGIAGALGAIFLIYDMRVTRRQNKTLQSAMRSRAIVNSLFPERIAKKMVEDSGDLPTTHRVPRNKRYESFMTTSDRAVKEDGKGSKPLADLFPEATVMFGDLVGFTAWSSPREPHHVFMLLETIYSTFDRAAARLGVFKVETIGDCYVAVCGVPTPRHDHASVMAQFAAECCRNLPTTLHELEIELGPDTSTLGIRIGLHSGPVTAGVLRGERARFQLFGDTVNTTSRIESTGEKNRVHVSEDTASLLIAAGREDWVQPRQDKVSAKGKGQLNTFWLVAPSSASAPSSDKTLDDSAVPTPKKSKSINKLGAGHERFVAWVVEILKKPLANIVERRAATRIKPDSSSRMKQAELEFMNTGRMAVDEIQEVIKLPQYNGKADRANKTASSNDVPPNVLSQLHDYVRAIACMYRPNAFHNYEHACHVLMSCSKLLSRIVSPEIDEIAGETANNESKLLHDHTYGITSDPLTQFAVILSALIHDLDHPGVPNVQLNKEHDVLAIQYSHKSAAEQHSLDAAWELLMQNAYSDLRRAIYCNRDELVRFRQLTVNAVMATDIMDKKLGQQRKARWNKAFADSPASLVGIALNPGLEQEDRNRKATIVIEHIIQASDVAHCMQHWNIYRKWNERLFRESYMAYKAGRSETNPLDSWYKGEIGFFDYYIIPLAKKLKECGVFGVSSDEYLSYAVQNRKEWVMKGEQVVADYAEIVRRKYS